MKKIALILIALFILSFKTNEEKKYTVSLTFQQWSLILEVVDQSNATHTQVKAVQELLVPVLNKQIADTLRK